MADPMLDAILSGKPAQASGDPLLDSILHGAKKSATGDQALDAALNPGSASGVTGDAVLDSILSGKPEKAPLPTEQPSHVWETAKGAGRGVIDLISRPMYAVAGAADELFTPQGGGLTAVPGRVFSEIYSGLPGVEGKKRDFTQVLERAGVGELGQLSDILPFLYNDTGEGPALQRGGWADPTGRGAIGLAGDIALDPTTYLTWGGSVTRRFVTKTGAKFLSPAGQDVLKGITKELGPTYRLLAETEDATLRQTGLRQVQETMRDRMEAATVKDPKLLDKTGIKWFGNEVVSAEALKGLSDKTKEIVLALPGGDRAARVAAGFRDGMRRLFDPFAEIAGLDADAREGVKNDLRDFHNSMAASSTRDFAEWAPLEAEERQLALKYGKGDIGIQALGKKFADWRQGTGEPALSDAEKALFDKVATNYEERGQRLVRNGVITGEQWDKYKGRYLLQDYKNKEVLSEVVAQAKHYGLTSPANFTAERQFETFADAVRISKGVRAEGLAGRAAGLTHPVYGELIPEYGITKNLATHIEKSNRSLWQSKLIDELRTKYGIEAGAYDASRVYDLQTPRQLAKPERAAIDKFIGDHGVLAGEDWGKAASSAKAILPLLSKDGKAELARSMVSASTSPGQVFSVREALGDALMPQIKAVRAGDIESFFTRHGLPEEKARLVPVSGGLWGEKETLIPKAIADMVDQVPRDIVMSAAARAHLGVLVKGYDKYNNLFKGLTYPFWPAGAVRDAYNNLQHSFLSLGIGGLARPGLAAKIQRGAESAAIEIGDHSFTAPQWKKVIEDLRVTDPSASSFVQFTGERGAEKASLYAKARSLRGNVDNVTRTQLFINGVGQGMSLEDAARMVHEFHYNYAELSSFDRDVMRRIIPFYVFPRKTIGLYAEQVLQRPGRLANLAKPFKGREDENQMMTSWEGEGFKLRLDRNGKDVTMLNGIDLPVRSLDMLWQGGPAKTLEGLVASASPAIKVPYEYIADRDPFRGQPFGRADEPTLGRAFEHFPKWAQDFVGFRKETDAAGRPKYTMRQDRIQPLVEAAMVSRFFSTPDRAFREQMREPNTAARWLDFLTGARFKTLNLDDEQRKKQAAGVRAAQEEAVKQGALKKFETIYRDKKAAQ